MANSRLARGSVSKWRSEVATFDQKKRDLWNDLRNRNKYVAMFRGSVVDVDSDKFALVRRTAAQFPNEIVLIAKVEVDERIAVISSPREAGSS